MVVPHKIKMAKPRKGIKKYFWIGSILFLVSSYEFFQTWDSEVLIKLNWLLGLRIVGLLAILRWLGSFIYGDELDSNFIEGMIIRTSRKIKEDDKE